MILYHFGPIIRVDLILERFQLGSANTPASFTCRHQAASLVQVQSAGHKGRCGAGTLPFSA